MFFCPFNKSSVLDFQGAAFFCGFIEKRYIVIFYQDVKRDFSVELFQMK